MRSFTLVEVLAAVTLLALLSVATMRVMRVLSLPAFRTEPSGVERARLARYIRTDLDAAQMVRVRPAGFDVLGYYEQPPGGGHAPCVLEYRVRPIGGRRWLLRGVRDPNPLSNAPAQAELMAEGVTSVELLAVPGPGMATAAMSGPIDSWQDAARQLDVQVGWAEEEADGTDQR